MTRTGMKRTIENAVRANEERKNLCVAGEMGLINKDC